MTHYFSQQFANQKCGVIILLSSIVAFHGSPYAVTKAYVQTLAEGIAEELKPYGADVLADAPGPVESGFSKRANMNMSMSLKPDQVAVPILKVLGKKTTVLPGLLTKILVYSLRMVPR
ncbi:MAG: SDR family NAD(P)-dependent oxidoreductase [Opitutaceae bacterium]|nr:SDR family NAD(P)-dependent oxidoreductase [Cytophagales bacterium]